MPDIFAIPDDEFNSFQANFMTYATANAGNLGLVPADLTPLATMQTAWASSFTTHVATQASANAATLTKDAARKAFETVLRALIARLQVSLSVSDAERASLKITVRSKDRRPAPVPLTRPVLQVDTGQRLCHMLSFTDEATPNSRAKPKGVMGCQIWAKVGEAPPNDCNDCEFLALDTSSPYLVEYTGAEKNQIAHYMARWVNTRSNPGPWSETVAATIGA